MDHWLLDLQLAASPSAPWRSSGSPPDSGGKSPCCGCQKTQCPSARLPVLLSIPAGHSTASARRNRLAPQTVCEPVPKDCDESMLGAALQMLTAWADATQRACQGRWQAGSHIPCHGQIACRLPLQHSLLSSQCRWVVCRVPVVVSAAILSQCSPPGWGWDPCCTSGGACKPH